jgi:hypothetical protein
LEITDDPKDLRDKLMNEFAIRPMTSDPKYYEELIPKLGAYYVCYKNDPRLPKYNPKHQPLWQWFTKVSDHCDRLLEQLNTVSDVSVVPMLQTTLSAHIEELILQLPDITFIE